MRTRTRFISDTRSKTNIAAGIELERGRWGLGSLFYTLTPQQKGDDLFSCTRLKAGGGTKTHDSKVHKTAKLDKLVSQTKLTAAASEPSLQPQVGRRNADDIFQGVHNKANAVPNILSSGVRMSRFSFSS